MSYSNTNGPHISRVIITDNVGVVRVSQGAGALGTASTGNLGGTIEFFSRAPLETFGINGNATYGSGNTFRGYANIDSGVLGSGGRGFLSYAYLDAGKWKGNGRQRSHQINAKFVQPIGSSTLTVLVNASDRREQDYQDLSLKMIGRLGYKVGNLFADFQLAKQIARVYQSGDKVYPAPYTSIDDAYYDVSGLRRDLIGSLKA